MVQDRSVPANYRSIDFVIDAPPTADDVRSLLRAVVDPELGADIVSLGMVPGVTVAPDGVVTVGIKLTIGGCPLRAQIKRDVEQRVALHPGVSDVRIEWGEMTAEERSDVMLKGQAATLKFDEAGNIDYVCGLHPTMKGTIEVAAR